LTHPSLVDSHSANIATMSAISPSFDVTPKLHGIAGAGQARFAVIFLLCHRPAQDASGRNFKLYHYKTDLIGRYQVSDSNHWLVDARHQTGRPRHVVSVFRKDLR
jgi:hypothetical protein